MTILKGIEIILVDKVENGVDEFNHPIFVDKEIVVKNVLVAPVKTEDVLNIVNLIGKRAEYQLGIPKGDTNTWENREVVFFGKKWRTIGIPQEGIESMIPLSWNRKIMVERYE
jgi:phage protein|nr:MAG TPA: Minor capsid protein [Siphoviridae sp. ct3an14]DAQ29786.1 MAG TPA: Minor capsid protein [Caudoviricetes sp.]DAS96982.1 MAG TPA: Minor capsid protein [Caudoviricetes sp.]